MKLHELLEAADTPGWSGSQRSIPAGEETFDEKRFYEEVRGKDTKKIARTSQEKRAKIRRDIQARLRVRNKTKERIQNRKSKLLTGKLNIGNH